MPGDATAASDKRVARVAAVLALFRGTPVKDITAEFQMGRSTLYKFTSRALTAMREALADRPRGPRQSHNRTAADTEAR
jgi:transposase